MASKEKREGIISRAQRRRTVAEPPASSWASAERRWFLIIAGSALVLRWLYLAQIGEIPLFHELAGDARTYDQWGARIAAGDWFGTGVFYQAPLYPYFLGVLQFLFGHNLWLIRFMQILMGAVSCGLIFLVATRLFSLRAGIIAGVLLATYAPAIFFDGLIEKSILDLFLLATLLWLMTQPGDRGTARRWLIIGLIVAFLGLSRENALVLIPILLLWIAFHSRVTALPIKFRWMGLFIVGLMIVLMPVGLRNYVAGGEFKLTTSQFGPNFFIGNNPKADGTYESVRQVILEPQLEGSDAKRLAEQKLGRSLRPGEVSEYWSGRAWAFIEDQPSAWLRLLTRKWLMVWNAREIEDSDDFYIYQQWSGLLALLAKLNHFGILTPLAFAGICFTAGHWRRLWWLYLMVLGFAAAVAVFYVFGRYRYPLVPMLVLFAGAGMAGLFERYHAGRWRSLAIVALVMCATATVVNWPLYKFSGPGPAGYNNLSNAFYKQGRAQEAIGYAQQAIAIDPDYGVAFYNLGNMFANQGRLDRAQKHFERALTLYPNYADAHSNLGQLLAQRGEVAAGVDHFRKAIELNPTIARAHLNLGIVYAQQGNARAALTRLQTAARLTPDAPEAHFAVGRVHAALGEFDRAADAFAIVLRLEPGNAEAHQSMAEVLSQLGKRAEAARHYDQAVKLLRLRQGAGAR